MSLTIEARYAFIGSHEEVRRRLTALGRHFRALGVRRARAPRYRDRFESYALAVIRRVEAGEISPPPGFEEHLGFLGFPIPYILPGSETTILDPGPSPFPGDPGSTEGPSLERREEWVRIRTPFYSQDVHPETELAIAREMRAWWLEVELGLAGRFDVRLGRLGTGDRWAGLATMHCDGSEAARIVMWLLFDACDRAGILLDMLAEGTIYRGRVSAVYAFEGDPLAPRRRISSAS